MFLYFLCKKNVLLLKSKIAFGAKKAEIYYDFNIFQDQMTKGGQHSNNPLGVPTAIFLYFTERDKTCDLI